MARGGRRQGRAGANYSNRSDMQTGPRLPVQAPPSQAYGERVALENAQRAVPLRAVPSPTAAGAPPTLTAGPPPPPPVALDAPTERPGEPLTAGSAFGSGPGPQALGITPAMDLRAEDIAAMKRYMPMFEAMASQPNASPATRNFVRRFRAAIPPGV